MNQNGKVQCFVASPGAPAELLSGLTSAVAQANAASPRHIFHLWTDNDIVGKSLVEPIYDGIDKSGFFIADITYLNLNVTYEVGYAIGRSKRAVLTRNITLVGDIELANEIGIFDTLGRFEYSSWDKLADYIAAFKETTPSGIEYPTDTVRRIFFLDIPGTSDAVRLIVSAIKSEFRLYRSFSDEESIRLSAPFAIENVSSSSGVIIPFLSPTYKKADIHNFRAMFVAGLAHGMDRPTLILKSANVVAPLNIRDSVSDYRDEHDIARLISRFRVDVNQTFEALTTKQSRDFSLLQQLTIGDSSAENEFTTLKAYYLPIDAFGRTLQGQVDLVTSRKGSGKSALFFQVRDNLRQNRQNVIVDLRPEGYQLTQLKETVLEFLKPGSQDYLLTSFWHYILLLEIVHRIIEMDDKRHQFDHRITETYRQLEGIYTTSDVELAGDFSQRLLILTRNVAKRYNELGTDRPSVISGGEITRLVYAHDIHRLEQVLAQYLRYKDAVWILFDNLDRGWSTGGVSPEDILILRSLINAARKLKRELEDKGVNIHTVVFVRNDVYELLMEGTADFGKEMRVNLDWTDRRQLEELLRRRFEFGFAPFKGKAIDEIWKTVFADVDDKILSLEYLVDLCLLRPRNLIKLIQHCKGLAVNVGHEKIQVADVVNALDAYSRDLAREINREISDVFPMADRMLYDFVGEKSRMSLDDVRVLAELKGLDSATAEKVIDLLLYYGVIELVGTDKRITYIYDVQYDMEIMKALIRKRGADVEVQVNPAFWPILRMTEPSVS